MYAMDLYQTMFLRKSVRKYDPAPLSGEVLEELERFVAGIPPLTDKGSARVRFLAPTQVARSISGPHYAVAYAAADRLSRLSAGYLMEYLALYLASRRLGCCYNGMAKPHASCATYEGLTAVMPMVLGTPAEPALRTGISAFKRKEIGQVCTPEVPKSLAEAVRVAPSAVNIQPWFLAAVPGGLEVRYAPRGLKAKLTTAYRDIDMGIALAHLRIAAEQQKMTLSFDFDIPPLEPLPKGQELVCRANFL